MAMHKPLEPVVIRRARIESRLPGSFASEAFPLLRGIVIRYFYGDTGAAELFYGRTLGLPGEPGSLALRDGLSAHRAVGRGRNGRRCPQTATLSFVTDDVEGWYAYLQGVGVAVEHESRTRPAPDARLCCGRSRGPSPRVEAFLDRPQNSRLRDALAKVAPLAPRRAARPVGPRGWSRPTSSGSTTGTSRPPACSTWTSSAPAFWSTRASPRSWPPRRPDSSGSSTGPRAFIRSRSARPCGSAC